MAMPATMVERTKPIQRKKSTTKCGRASSHLNSHCQRPTSGSSSPVRRSGKTLRGEVMSLVLLVIGVVGLALDLLPSRQGDPNSRSGPTGEVDFAANDRGIDQDSATERGGDASAPGVALTAANACVSARDHRLRAPSIEVVGSRRLP